MHPCLQELVRSRVFQAGVKFWLAISTVLVLILGIAGRGDQAGYDVRTYRPIFGYIATCLAMSERVSGPCGTVRRGAVLCCTVKR